MIFKSEEEARECLAHWQKILRLQDWEIAILIARQCDIPSSTSVNGHIGIVTTKKRAKIWLLDPQDEDVKGTEPFRLDHQEVIVHELLHLHLAGCVDDAKELEEEQAVHAISNAFVFLHSWYRQRHLNLPYEEVEFETIPGTNTETIKGYSARHAETQALIAESVKVAGECSDAKWRAIDRIAAAQHAYINGVHDPRGQ